MKRKTTELAGEFPPVANFYEVGEFLEGEYRGSEEIMLKTGKTMRAFSIKLDDWTCSFERNKTELEPKNGDMVSVSGSVVERGLGKAQIGNTVRITYKGKGPSQYGEGKTNLFLVELVELVEA